MNKKLSLLAATLLLAGAASAQTVSGTVMQTNGAAVAGQYVMAMTDSTATMAYWGNGATDAAGNYSFTLNGTPPAGMVVHIYTYACSTSFNTDVPYSDPGVNANFTICNAPQQEVVLHGQITLGNDSLAGAADAMVYVINKHYDSTGMGYVLDLVDSIPTTSGGYYNRTYASAAALPAASNLLMKAALKPTATDYADYLPTYFTSSLSWSGATALSNIYLNGTSVNIALLEGVNPGGPGFISGSVLQGAGKPSGVGDMLPGRIVILTQADGTTPVAYHVTDASGTFSFDNLAYGTYHIFGDVWGVANPHLIVTLSAGSPNIPNVRFEENSTGFTGSLSALGINDAANAQLAAIRVSPLPVRNELNVQGLAAIDGAKTVTLTSMSGQVIYRADVKAGADAIVPATSLASGLYLLNVKTAQGSLLMKVAK